jgi:hypothetical protein
MWKFTWSDTLSVVGRQLRCYPANAASDSLLVEIDRRVAVEDSLTGASEGSIFEKGIGGLLLRSVM